jgi:chromate transporter
MVGFGGPPAHIALLRKLCVEERGWLSAREFEDGIAATSLLPGPASTQLAIFCAGRVGGPLGAILGGVCFIAPGLVIILGLAAVFLTDRPSLWVLGAAAGAGAAVPAVAVHAAVGLLPASSRRSGGVRATRMRWILYLGAGAVATATIGPYLVIVLLACGLLEAVVRLRPDPGRTASVGLFPALGIQAAVAGGLGAVGWVAFKVGALSFGGGFVIIPLMQHDAVTTYHWMTGAQFLNAVALGQVTPGPVVQTVAVVGYAAAGVAGGLFAALVAFAPSFVFVLGGAPHFERLRSSQRLQAFLGGAGPAAIGAIAGAAIPLGLELTHLWQLAILAIAAAWLLGLRKGVVGALLGSGILGVIAVLAGLPVSH